MQKFSENRNDSLDSLMKYIRQDEKMQNSKNIMNYKDNPIVQTFFEQNQLDQNIK